MKKALLGIVVIGVMVALYLAYAFRSMEQRDFPYSYSLAGVQIHPKDSSAAMGRRSVYQISAGEIEGEAVLTPVPSAVEGNAMVDSLVFGVKSAFQERPAPYGGQITALIACDSQKYVKEEAIPFAGRDARLVRAVASGRKIYGSCSAEEIKHASVSLAGFDELRKQVVAVKLYKPIANVSEVVAAQEAILKILHQVFGHP